MHFGQSVFQSVLTRLEQERLEEEARNGADPHARAPAHRTRGLTTGFVADVLEGVCVSVWRPDQPWLDFSGEPGEEPEETATEAPPVMPDHLARTAPEDVAYELAISRADTLQSLGEKRRRFAKMNHPDSVPHAFRDNANSRMMVANLLIDEAIRRLGATA